MCAIRCHDGNCAAVGNSITNAVGAKSAENDGMHRANACTGQHGNRGLGNIREIDNDAIALFDLVPFEHIREAENFVMQLLVSYVALIAGFALPNYCCIVSSATG